MRLRDLSFELDVALLSLGVAVDPCVESGPLPLFAGAPVEPDVLSLGLLVSLPLLIRELPSGLRSEVVFELELLGGMVEPSPVEGDGVTSLPLFDGVASLFDGVLLVLPGATTCLPCAVFDCA